MKILDVLAPIYYEFLAKFIPRKVFYDVKGECKKCAKCCRYMFCNGLRSKFEFAFLQFVFPEYKRFAIAGRDEFGNFVIHCTLIDKDDLCPVHGKRPNVCRNYPLKRSTHRLVLHKDCGFSSAPEKSFKDFLE